MVTKRLCLAVTLAACAWHAHAKEIPRGKAYLSGDTTFRYAVSNAGSGLSNDSAAKNTTLTTSEASFNGKLGYFLFKNVAIGMTAGYRMQTVVVDNRTLYAGGLEARLYQPVTSADIVRLVVTAGAEATRGTVTNGNMSDSLQGVRGHVAAGVAYSITESALLNILVEYTDSRYSNDIYNENGMAMGAGIDILF